MLKIVRSCCYVVFMVCHVSTAYGSSFSFAAPLNGARYEGRDAQARRLRRAGRWRVKKERIRIAQ